MLFIVWIVFFFGMLFLLGSSVGSFLNVCIVRLPEGRSLIRPGSSCPNCHKAIRMEDNLPLVSYWLLRGRCRQCGAPFSMRYFWIELLTGLAFVAIFHLEIGRNIHHFDLWSDGGYSPFEGGQFPRHWLPLFVAHALMVCFLIVATQCNREHQRVPASVTWPGVLIGLIVATLCPWPWPDPAGQAVGNLPEHMLPIRPPDKPYEGGPQVGPMPAGDPWWRADVTPHAGLYPWPVWGPLPDGLPPGSWQLGLATGLAGVVAGAALTWLVRLLFNAGTGTAALGWGEVSLMMIAGAFLGWQPVVVAGLIALIPGLAAATVQWAVWKRQRVTYSLWLALALVPVWLGWYWIGPLVQGLFFSQARLLLFASGCVAWL